MLIQISEKTKFCHLALTDISHLGTTLGNKCLEKTYACFKRSMLFVVVFPAELLGEKPYNSV